MRIATEYIAVSQKAVSYAFTVYDAPGVLNEYVKLSFIVEYCNIPLLLYTPHHTSPSALVAKSTGIPAHNASVDEVISNASFTVMVFVVTNGPQRKRSQ